MTTVRLQLPVAELVFAVLLPLCIVCYLMFGFWATKKQLSVLHCWCAFCTQAAEINFKFVELKNRIETNFNPIGVLGGIEQPHNVINKYFKVYGLFDGITNRKQNITQIIR